jgi:hypothetical protein
MFNFNEYFDKYYWHLFAGESYQVVKITVTFCVQVRVLLREDAGGQGEHCRVHAVRLHQDPLHCPHCQGPGRRAQQVIGLHMFVVSSFFLNTKIQFF